MKVNGEVRQIGAAWRGATLLQFLRDGLGLTGTKFGCGKGVCGACTVHIDGQAVRACITPLNRVVSAEVTTIEGLASPAGLHPVQQAWVELGVPQCGYCQPGQVMTAAAFLEQNDNPSPRQVEQAMNGNLCRCGTQPRIKQGVLRAAAAIREAQA